MNDNRFAPAVAPIGAAGRRGPAALLGGSQKRNDKLAEWLAKCPKMDTASFMKACFGKGGLPAAPWANEDHPITTQEVVSILCALGRFEPEGTRRPTACDPVFIYDKTVEVEPATIDAAGKITPSVNKLVRFCAPSDRSLVVDELRAFPANLTAAEFGEVFVKTMQVMGFSEGFCPPGEPGDGDGLGTFQMVEHLVLCPSAGFDLHARNPDPFSPALFHIFARAWTTC